MSRLQRAGLWLKRSKCTFMFPLVEYLGYVIDKDGLHPSQQKVKAIKNAPRLNNSTELKAYLGLLTYYKKFLPNIGPLVFLAEKRYEMVLAQPTRGGI